MTPEHFRPAADSQAVPAGPVAVLCVCELHVHLVVGCAAGQSPTGSAPRPPADLAGQPGRAELLASQRLLAPKQAMGLTAPALQGCLKVLGLAPADLAGLAVVRGPGSFSGLRIALSLAAGISAGCGVPTAGLEYLPLIAATAADCLHPGETTLAVLTRARRGQVYTQFFAPGAWPSTAPAAKGPLDVLSAAQAAAALAEMADGGSVAVCGSGLAANPDIFTPEYYRSVAVRRLPRDADAPSDTALLRAALRAQYGHTPVAPLYVRASDAEDTLPPAQRAKLEAARLQGDS